MVQSNNVDKVTFTGSLDVGKKIVQAAAGNLKRVTLELGGKSPNVIFADTDLESAIPAAAQGISRNTGQVCCAGSRLYVEKRIFDRVVEGIGECAKQIKLGAALNPDSVRDSEALIEDGPPVQLEGYQGVSLQSVQQAGG